MKTTSFEPAKRLDELGVKRDSSFSWHYDKNLWPSPVLKYISPISSVFRGVELYAAYTLDELLEMLPAQIGEIPNEIYLDICKHIHFMEDMDSVYEISYDDGVCPPFNNQNPAEAAGELLAWCVENGYIDPKKL